MDQRHRYAMAKKATLVGACVNTLLAFMKVIAGVLCHSHALVADGIHSFADLLTDAMVLIGAKYSSQDADDMHPYGHQRIETATTLFLSLILILAGVGIAWDALSEIIYKSHDIPKFLALPVAIFSILANELLFHYTRHIGKTIQSDLIITNAWHHRSDAASSFVVLLGLIGSFVGYAGFDAIAAVIVSMLIMKMGWDYGWNSVKELVDTAISPEVQQQAATLVAQVDGVIKIHQLRSRSMAGDVFIDLHIQVSPWITVSEGHFIAQHVHQTLLDNIKTIKDVTVHVDPEDDEISNPSHHLPSRKTLETACLNPLKHQFPVIQYWLIHYLDGKITIDLFCQRTVTTTIFKTIEQTLKQNEHINTVRFFTVISCPP